MEDFSTLFTIAFAAIFVNNFVLAKFLGLCPFIGVSQKTENALGMGMAVTFVMTMASAITYLIYAYLLRAGESNIFYKMGWITIDRDLSPVLRTVSYILVIATMVQLVEMFMRKFVPALYQALGIYLPLITTNCAVLGVALLNTTDAPAATKITQTNFFFATFQGFCAGIGFSIAMLLMSGIRERLALAPVPKPLQDVPIAFISTSMMALAFLGFSGMVAA